MRVRSVLMAGVVVVLLAALGLGLAGCGPMSEEEYKADAGQAVKDLVTSMEEFDKIERPENIEQARQIIDDKLGEISEIKKRIDGFNPPDSYKDTQETLQSAASGIEKFFQDAKKVFDEAEDMDAADEALAGLESSFTDFLTAAQNLQTVADELEVDLGTGAQPSEETTP